MNPICLLCRAAKSIRPDPIWKISSSDPIKLLTKPIRCIFANPIRLWSDRSKPDPIWKSDRVGLKIKKNKINETKWQTKQTIKQILDLNEKNMWTHTRTHTTRSYTKRARASEIGDGETPNSNRTKNNKQSLMQPREAKPSLQPRSANAIYYTSTATACCRLLHLGSH